jgi:hypothetical protein
MSHLNLAAAATQHAAQWHASHAQTSDLRVLGIIAAPFLIAGMIRTIVKGLAAKAAERADAEEAASQERLEQRYAA